MTGAWHFILYIWATSSTIYGVWLLHAWIGRAFTRRAVYDEDVARRLEFIRTRSTLP